ncbi:MAG: hypothetical protein AAFZ18_29720, partial [Myxococcota bacterium]
GAMGAVYVARQLSVDRRVALKMMSGRSLLDGEESLQRFYREVRNATRPVSSESPESSLTGKVGIL